GRRAQVVLRLGPGPPLAGRATPIGSPALGGRAFPSRRQAGTGAGRLPGPHLARAPPPPGAGLLDVVLCPPPQPWVAHDHHRSHGPFPPDGVCPPHAANSWRIWSSPSGATCVTRAFRYPLAPPPAAVFHLIRHDAKVVLNALPQFMTEIDGLDIHFVHVRSNQNNALPL